jgi:protease-4
MSEDTVGTTPSNTTSASPADRSPWERDLIEKVLLETLKEQRRARRWSLVLKLALLAYLAVAMWMAASPFSDQRLGGAAAHTAVIDITGLISEGAKTNAESIVKSLKAAAKDQQTKGIVLKMNSPGGTPVQAAYVYEEIRDIKQSHPSLPVIAVASDLCASGCYYIAAAADKIFVNPSTIVGSIGVIMNGFGFVDAMQKVGVERRAFTAGEHKALLDPFKAINPAEKAQVQKVLDGIHQQFIAAVRAGRGSRLKETPEIFSGLVWTGTDAISLGLADAIGDVHSVAEKEIGAEELVDFTSKEDWLERFSRRFGTTMSGALWDAGMPGAMLR